MIDRGIQFVVVKKALGGGGGDGKTRWEAHPGKGADLAKIGHFFPGEFDLVTFYLLQRQDEDIGNPGLVAFQKRIDGLLNLGENLP